LQFRKQLGLSIFIGLEYMLLQAVDYLLLSQANEMLCLSKTSTSALQSNGYSEIFLLQDRESA